MRSAPDSSRVDRQLDFRYVGQAYELLVLFAADFQARFHPEREKAYEYAHARRSMKIVNLRLRLVIGTPEPRTPPRRAQPTTDGLSSVHKHMTNSLNTRSEVLERAYPVRVRRIRCAGDPETPGGIAAARVSSAKSSSLPTLAGVSSPSAHSRPTADV